MHTKMTENEVNRVPIDALVHSLQKLPYNAQNGSDRALAEHFLLRALSSSITSKLKKIEEPLKKGFRAEEIEPIAITENWRRELSSGTPRQAFDLDLFIQMVAEAYPQVLPHKLRELSLAAKRESAAPISFTIEYIGDVTRQPND